MTPRMLARIRGIFLLRPQKILRGQIAFTFRRQSISVPARAVKRFAPGVKTIVPSMMAAKTNAGPLEGISVVECGQGISSSFAARLMADLGAEVVKLEPPHGDRIRRRGPFPGDRPDPEKSGLFIYLNVNKRGIVIDLEKGEGRAMLLGLLRGADVLIHNVHPADRDAIGLGSSEIAALHPHLIITTVSPFGDTGPYRDWRARSLNIVHGGGWAFLTPLGSTQPELPPLKVFGQQGDFLAGSHALYATLAALWHRNRTGQGRIIDVSEQECVASILEMHLMRYTYGGREISRLDEYRTGVSGIVNCSDGEVYILAHEEAEWDRLLDVIGHPAWAADERFKNSPSRAANHAAVLVLLEECTKRRTVDEFFATCREHNVICAPINTMKRAFGDRHFVARGCLASVDQPGLGPLPIPGPPSRFSAGAKPRYRPAPALGQHTDEILSQRLGMTPDEIAALRSREVI
jgi:CoA:oxalate CoA-transferase